MIISVAMANRYQDLPKNKMMESWSRSLLLKDRRTFSALEVVIICISKRTKYRLGHYIHILYEKKIAATIFNKCY